MPKNTQLVCYNPGMKTKLPYGLSNFKDVILGGYIYVDKTAYIAQLEDSGKYNILLRPRRFGKSLLLSAMEYYYDSHYAADFDSLFATARDCRAPQAQCVGGVDGWGAHSSGKCCVISLNATVLS